MILAFKENDQFLKKFRKSSISAIKSIKHYFYMGQNKKLTNTQFCHSSILLTGLVDTSADISSPFFVIRVNMLAEELVETSCGLARGP